MSSCRECGARVSAQAAFCGACGARLSGASVGQRREGSEADVSWAPPSGRSAGDWPERGSTASSTGALAAGGEEEPAGEAPISGARLAALAIAVGGLAALSVGLLVSRFAAGPDEVDLPEAPAIATLDRAQATNPLRPAARPARKPKRPYAVRPVADSKTQGTARVDRSDPTPGALTPPSPAGEGSLPTPTPAATTATAPPTAPPATPAPDPSPASSLDPALANAEHTPRTAEEMAEDERDAAYAEAIAYVVSSHRPQVAVCYERAFKDGAAAPAGARVELAFTVRTDGAPRDVQVVENTTGKDALGLCLSQRLAEWHFPRPPGEGEFHATYPFVFQRSGQ